MESPPPAVFHDKAKRTQQGDLLRYPHQYANYYENIWMDNDFDTNIDIDNGNDIAYQTCPGCSTVGARTSAASLCLAAWSVVVTQTGLCSRIVVAVPPSRRPAAVCTTSSAPTPRIQRRLSAFPTS